MTLRRVPRPRFLPRVIAAVASFTLALAGLVFVAASPAQAGPSPTRAFTSVFTTNTTGDVIIRGNTLETCLAGSVQAQGSITCESAQNGASQQNNNYFMTYVDTDGATGIGATTFDSSTATVTVPAGATVLYAGLSWGANTAAGSLDKYPALTGVAAPSAALRGSALFQAPGASAYTTVTSAAPDGTSVNYQSYADVTSTVKAAGTGVYSVANVQAGTGGGSYAGWSLAVAFSDPTMPTRNLTVFTGYNSVSSSATSVDIPVSGFTTPATGQVKTSVGVVAYEGDKGSTGDSMSIGSTALANSLNPVSDVFNSSITDLNVAVTDRTPSYANTLGYDIDRFDATGALANGSTSTTIHLTTSAETYYPGMVTFATDLYASALTATKTVIDVNGGTVSRNDVLSYSITVTNGGGDGATATVLTDAAPPNTTYVPGSLVVGGTAVTDGSGDDTGDVSAGNVTARLGTGATASAGGLLAPAATSTVTFRVTVNASATDASSIPNTALFSSNNQTTGSSTAGGSNTVTSAVVVPPILGGTLTSPGEVGAAYSSGLTVSNGTGPYTWSISGGALPGGLSINASTGVISGTPTTAGTTPFTVRVTDINSRTTTRGQSITVIAGPSVTFTPPTGEVGASYSAQPTVSGGSGPYTWAVSAGTLPAGLTLNTSTGLISGTPTTAGSADFTVQATDANSVSANKAVTIAVGPGPALTFAAPPAGEVTIAYSNQLTVTGGVSPYTWSVSSGALPAGLTLNAGTGLLSGTPTAAGSFNFVVKAVDANGVFDTKPVALTVAAAPTLTFTAPPAGEVGTSYSKQLTFSGGVGPYVWSISAGSLPAGVTLDAGTGLLSGTPTASGSSTFTVRLVDSNGLADTKSATLVIAKSTTTASVSAPSSARFGTSVTISATVAPASAGGTVTFTDVPTTGPQSGTTVTLGGATLAGGTASIDVVLPAFGLNAVTAHYAGGGQAAPADSTAAQVEISAFAGELIVTEFRPSGPAGAADSYVELLNTGAAVPLAGIVVRTSSGSVSTLPANAGMLGTRRSYLLTGSAFSLGAVATSDFATTLGTGGIEVVAPDTARTQTDAVGPTSGFHVGTGLSPMTGTPTAQYAWVRNELAGAAVDSRNNANDFVLVSSTLAPVGGVTPTLGSASPTGTADPFQHNAGLTSTLLDPNSGVGVAPNRVVVAGTPGKLTIRRTITNTSGATITAAKVRVSALSELNGPPQPGVGMQPATVADLRAINPSASTEVVRVSGGASVTVQDLSVDAPSTAAPGGGLNSTLTVPLPGGGLAPGATINVAFTFAVDTHGTFWFGYDVDATTGATAARRLAPSRAAGAQSAGRPAARRGSTKPADSGRIR